MDPAVGCLETHVDDVEYEHPYRLCLWSIFRSPLENQGRLSDRSFDVFLYLVCWGFHVVILCYWASLYSRSGMVSVVVVGIIAAVLAHSAAGFTTSTTAALPRSHRHRQLPTPWIQQQQQQRIVTTPTTTTATTTTTTSTKSSTTTLYMDISQGPSFVSAMDQVMANPVYTWLAASSSFPTSMMMILPPTVLRAVELGAFPAVGMNVVTLLGLGVATPPKVVGALQHFSAGILLTTIAKELLPEMVQAQGWAENVASGVGFFAGVGVLILLGIVFPEEEGEGDDYNKYKKEESQIVADVLDKGEPVPLATMATTTTTATTTTNATIAHESIKETSLRNRKQSLKSRAYHLQQKESQSAVASLSQPSMENVVAALPTALLAAVAIDSALDGLLIGISTAVDPKTGPLLSASLTVESSFLGLTIAAALRACPTRSWILLAAAALAPAGIITGAISGGGLAPLLATNTVLLTACLGFGTSTTLFMVAEELLLQAHEDGSEHTWWVDLQLYTGFFASVMIEKFFGM